MISIHDVWDDAKTDHNAYVTKRLEGLLTKLPNQAGYIRSPQFRAFVQKNLPNFATGDVQKLRDIIADAESTCKPLSKGQVKNFNSSAKKAFDYSLFCQKNVQRWSAYKLCAKARNTICPYCNQAFSFTVVGTTGSYRPTLDHFFPKAEYPYLALSLYNLVPSCYICNSSLKGTKNFFKTRHLHPLEDIDEDVLRFEIVSSNGNYTFDQLLHDDKLLSEFGTVQPRTQSPIAKRSIETFLLKERFAANLPTIKRFIRDRRDLNKNSINMYSELFGRKMEVTDLLRFDPEEYKNQMLGKILRDMYYAFDPSASGDES
ncbi:hypothetical protein SAMN05216466_12743 [Paraburkholderia phenazinium]|uniref:HNH endonuclease n=1 Tax=Paraburkholderia phenazinium TaxID=60549 RepID=A0A1G8I001_9BURK|nr:hypothetical protein [Paraburkholderia phenazinium]SDI12177.1 hypothetical protein SAMN05216466_117134 [Paraburkholderia phenazinium]SDI59441.1 hypothetical protein SAMN05216466_12743 [Paraburkholderia phenazinium]